MVVNTLQRSLTNSYTPEQNGVAERAWRTLTGMTRAMLKTAGLGNEWWGRAIVTAAYLKNMVLTKANKDFKTPYELFVGRRPSQ